MILYLLDKNFFLERWSQKESYAKQRKGYTQNYRQLKEHDLLRESIRFRCSLKHDNKGHESGEVCEDQTVENIWMGHVEEMELDLWTSQSQ